MSPKNTPLNKKHVAHLAKVRRQSQIIKYITIGIFVFVGIVILTGLVINAGFPPYQNVARVNGENLSADDFKTLVKLERNSLLRQYSQTLEFAQMLGLDPATDPNVSGQLQQIASQLAAANKTVLGQQVLDKMIEDALLRQEAERLGLSVSDDELDKYIKEDQFGFYANGTPTAQPTATQFVLPTLNATQLAIVTITPTSSPFPTLTPGPTAIPTEAPTTDPAATSTATSIPQPTATPYTLDGFQQSYKDVVEQYGTDFGMDESFFRDYFFIQPLLRQKVMDSITAELKPEEEQVWARHILVATEEEANLVYDRLAAGEDFGDLARELSTDTGSGALGGDLGWFGRGRMIQEFEDAAFSQVVGEIGKPVQSQYGYHIIQVLGHENRPLSDSEFENVEQLAISEWVAQAKEKAKITTYDFWKTIVPLEPSLEGQ
jgi:parvulin-like peptidyl-prolyl isomerase